jgi:hypothetical protein
MSSNDPVPSKRPARLQLPQSHKQDSPAWPLHDSDSTNYADIHAAVGHLLRRVRAVSCVPTSPHRPASVRFALRRSSEFHEVGQRRPHAVGVGSRLRRKCAELPRAPRDRQPASAVQAPAAGPMWPARSAISAIRIARATRMPRPGGDVVIDSILGILMWLPVMLVPVIFGLFIIVPFLLDAEPRPAVGLLSREAGPSTKPADDQRPGPTTRPGLPPVHGRNALARRRARLVWRTGLVRTFLIKAEWLIPTRPGPLLIQRLDIGRMRGALRAAGLVTDPAAQPDRLPDPPSRAAHTEAA